MYASKRDLRIEQGSTYRATIQWKDQSGQPVNLSECKARMDIRVNQGLTPAVEMSTDNGYLNISDPNEGMIEFHIPASVTALFSRSVYFYDLEVLFPNNDVVRVMEGRVNVSPNITQDPNDPIIRRVE